MCVLSGITTSIVVPLQTLPPPQFLNVSQLLSNLSHMLGF